MGFTINGIGTTFRGQCKFRRDGSYQTTKWFALFWIPLVPMATYRVQRENSGDDVGPTHYSTGFRVLEIMLVDKTQVLRTYGFVFGSVLWAVLVAWGLASIRNDAFPDAASYKLPGVLLALAVPWIGLWLARRLARSRAIDG